jgi:hypothetical protein
MNPNYLFKDELFYELKIRGISSDGDALELRKKLRSVIFRDVDFQWEYLTSVSVDELYSCVTAKVYELQSLVQRESTLPFLRPRVHTRLLHVCGRLQHLTAAGLCTTSSEAAAVQKIHAVLDGIELVMASVESKETSTGETPNPEVSRTDGSENQNEVRSFSFNNILGFASASYQKLTNPLTNLLKELPVIDGNDVSHQAETFL